jgi:hypothetical protein
MKCDTDTNMGRRSREKRDRTPAPVPRFSQIGFSLSKSTWLSVIGVIVLSYGIAAMQYSRWNHAENARVHPVFHPWAIIVGLATIVLSFKISNGHNRP